MKAVGGCIVRGAVIAACVFGAGKSIRIAVVDWFAAAGTDQGLERAVGMLPSDAVLISQLALRRDAADASDAADRDLLNAHRLDPLNADLLIALGLRQEFRGNAGEAERWLARAAEVDHTFKPAWTLANLYYRTNQPDKFWRAIHRCLQLDPLVFDLTPVFDLCRNETSDGRKILSQIRERGPEAGEYLSYLLSRNLWDQAIEAWPKALAAADPGRPGEVDALAAFPEAMEAENRMAVAVSSWNELIDRKIVASGRLDPGAGMSIADPEFAYPLLERAFGWRVVHEPGVFANQNNSSMRFEFDGSEAQTVMLLRTVAPLIPARTYRLVWRADGSRLSAPEDPGFAFRITRRPGDSTVACEPLLANGGNGQCRFSTVPSTSRAWVELIYSRALGTTRIEGMVRVNSVRLEFGA